MKAVNKCIRCFRMNPRVVEHIMADLPKERLDDLMRSKSLALTFAGHFSTSQRREASLQ